MNRHEAMRSLNLIVAEHDAARRAVALLLSRATIEPAILPPGGPNLGDLRACLRNLERTYLVRLFAFFEETLRAIWKESFRRRTAPTAAVLLNRCAARRRIDQAVVASVHGVREYRNSVIHGASAAPVGLAESKRRLCKFLAWMPEQW